MFDAYIKLVQQVGFPISVVTFIFYYMVRMAPVVAKAIELQAKQTLLLEQLANKIDSICMKENIK